MGKLYYNGVLLPQIPADALAEYPYCWIRKDDTNSRYNLVFGVKPWYYMSSSGVGMYCGDMASLPYYNINFSDADTAEEWTYAKDGGGVYFTINATRTVMWSNHDIPNGSATAVDIYFYGSEPLAMKYVVSTETMIDIADAIRAKIGSSDYLTPAEMVTAIGMLKALSEGAIIETGTFTPESDTTIIDNNIYINRELWGDDFPSYLIIFEDPNESLSEAYSAVTGLKIAYIEYTDITLSGMNYNLTYNLMMCGYSSNFSSVYFDYGYQRSVIYNGALFDSGHMANTFGNNYGMPVTAGKTYKWVAIKV